MQTRVTNVPIHVPERMELVSVWDPIDAQQMRRVVCVRIRMLQIHAQQVRHDGLDHVCVGELIRVLLRHGVHSAVVYVPMFSLTFHAHGLLGPMRVFASLNLFRGCVVPYAHARRPCAPDLTGRAVCHFQYF